LNTENSSDLEKIERLSAARKRILSLPPEKGLSAILESADAKDLVRSFPEEDFHFLIHEIGFGDSLPIISLASDDQWEYLLDMEVWERDRLDPTACTRWLELLFDADPNRTIEWLLAEKIDFIAHYLSTNIEVVVRSHEQDPSEIGDAFFTFDDVFYVRFKEDPSEWQRIDAEDRAEFKNLRDRFLKRFLERLAELDHVRYQQVLFESTGVIPAEAEESNYRFRSVRLAEKGFLPYEEAIGVYQPLAPEDVGKLAPKRSSPLPETEARLPVPFSPFAALDAKNPFAVALKRLETRPRFEELQAELAALCNRILSADRKIIRSREQLRPIVEKACGYLEIGLDRLAGSDIRKDPARAAAWIEKTPLSSIFRVGYGAGLELKWRAEKWVKESWFRKEGLPLSFWGEGYMGVLGGLLVKRPLFFAGGRTGDIYREFASLEEITETERVFIEIAEMDALLSRLAVIPPERPEGLLTFKNLLLTLWADAALGIGPPQGDPPAPIPLTLKELKRFFDMLWAVRKKPRKIGVETKTAFLGWLSEKSGLPDEEIATKLGRAFEALFEEIESEYGRVSKKDLDPRFIRLFLLTGRPPTPEPHDPLEAQPPR
jgi:hypothetical protein